MQTIVNSRFFSWVKQAYFISCWKNSTRLNNHSIWIYLKQVGSIHLVAGFSTWLFPPLHIWWKCVPYSIIASPLKYNSHLTNEKKSWEILALCQCWGARKWRKQDPDPSASCLEVRSSLLQRPVVAMRSHRWQEKTPLSFKPQNGPLPWMEHLSGQFFLSWEFYEFPNLLLRGVAWAAREVFTTCLWVHLHGSEP